MGLLIIDEAKCKRDGICVRDCPTAVIQLQDGRYPEIPKSKEANCMECGHCLAVCPHGALAHQRISMENSPEILDSLRINEKQAEQFLRSRRSIRLFQDKPVEMEKILRLIEVARYAPTAGNSQRVEWLAISDRSKIAKISECTVDWLREMIKDPRVTAASPYLPMVVAAWDAGFDTVLRKAPVVIVAMAPKEAINGTVDLTLALSYLDLIAPALGMGTCWAGLLQGALLASPALKKMVGVPEAYPHHYPMMLGYSAVQYRRVPERKTPKIIFA
jgi:nitroreductase/NAD-dependent dihydropyrimidine dehydrogenase PreA subunit